MKDAKNIKTDLFMYLSYRLGHRYVVTEGLNYSDVFSINRNGYSCEYEIKVSEGDLDAELKHILSSVEPKRGWHRGENKAQKHYFYRLGKPLIDEKSPNWFGGLLGFTFRVQNKFYFVIPDSLYSYLYMKVADTPYGIMVFYENLDYWTMGVKKQADFLHKAKAGAEIKELMLARSVNEVLWLRQKYMRYEEDSNKKLRTPVPYDYER